MLAMMVASSSAMQCAGGLLRTTPPSCARAVAPAMDETMFEKALAGELEDEGLENPYMSEVGWASFLDKEGQQSYNLNERPSKAQDGYFTPDIFSNPLSILESWKDSMLRVSNDPLESSFMTISNDQSGARSYGPGKQEKDARTIKPKPKKLEDVKEYSKMRVKNIPGYNLFGTPSSKSQGLPTIFGVPEAPEDTKKKAEKGPGLFEQVAGFFGGQ